MGGSIGGHGRRVLTPAVTAAAAFAALAAVVSVVFVSARGGLQLPIAATASPGIAVASAPPSATVNGSVPTPAGTTGPIATPAATAVPSVEPSLPPGTPEPTAAPTGPADPLLALPICPDRPGCFLYTVQRGDSFIAISDRFGLLLWITRALNPEVTNASVILPGQTLYLGRDPMARLAPCPGGAACRLYPVRAGDTLSTIAGRYGLALSGILELNPGLDPATIVRGQVIRLPLYPG